MSASLALVDGKGAKASLAKVEVNDGSLSIAASREAHARLAAALGDLDLDAQSMLIGQLIELLPRSADLTVSLNAITALLEGAAPTNGAEAMLASQMIASHLMSMNFARRSLKADDPNFANVYANVATKAQRTFAAQIEGLAKLRRNGEQTVKHVHVNAGGQAVIADTVHTGGGGNG